MTTRDKILATSRKLFNKKGTGKVPVRDICEKLEISLGNFTYYFPDKQKIMVDLYHKMIQDIEGVDDKIAISKGSILFLLEYHRQVFIIQNKYRFFYLNTFELINSSPKIKQAYLLHIEKEKKMMQALLQSYTKNGVLQKEIPPPFLEKLVTVSQMVNSFWMIDAELRFKGSENKKLIRYLELCCSLIEPHLTSSALKEFKGYFEELEKQKSPI